MSDNASTDRFPFLHKSLILRLYRRLPNGRKKALVRNDVVTMIVRQEVAIVSRTSVSVHTQLTALAQLRRFCQKLSGQDASIAQMGKLA